MYIKEIIKGCQGKKELFIFSARSISEKESKQLGYELQSHYTHTKLVNYNLSQLQKVTESYEKLWEISNVFSIKKQTKFLSKIDKSKWLHIVDSILKSSMLLVKAITEY